MRTDNLHAVDFMHSTYRTLDVHCSMSCVRKKYNFLFLDILIGHKWSSYSISGLFIYYMTKYLTL